MLTTCFLSISDSSEQRAQHQRKLVNVQHLVQQFTMTAIVETHVTGAVAVLVQEAWADRFNPALVTVVDGVIVALMWGM